MKTKTTLAALLLAAVMVTPSYGATENFIKGAEYYLKGVKDKDGLRTFFIGYCDAAAYCLKIRFPPNVEFDQTAMVVARYVYMHPEHHHERGSYMVKRACEEAWPKENKGSKPFDWSKKDSSSFSEWFQ